MKQMTYMSAMGGMGGSMCYMGFMRSIGGMEGGGFGGFMALLMGNTGGGTREASNQTHGTTEEVNADDANKGNDA